MTKRTQIIKSIIGVMILLFTMNFSLVAQNGEDNDVIDYSVANTYTLGGVKVEGTEFYDVNVIRSISGLVVGQEIDIPGDDVSRAVRKLWNNNLFADVSIKIDRYEGETVFLTINVSEKPRLVDFEFIGIKTGDKDDIVGKLEPLKRRPITDGMIISVKNRIKDFYGEKGFLKTEVKVTPKVDPVKKNSAILVVEVEKNIKVKIKEIAFIGQKQGDVGKMKKAMKNTREKAHFQILQRTPNSNDDRTKKEKASDAIYTAANLNIASIQNFFSNRSNPNIFKSSKFNEDLYESDKRELINYYNSIGYRDAKITRDTFYYVGEADIKVEIYIDEGNRYRFRNITWKGNAKYSDEFLGKVLGIKKGDVYNASLLQLKLEMDPAGTDVSSLYYDDGYLFFQINPKEVAVVQDSIDIEIRINEGPQATIKNIIIKGNDKTNEHVIRRELRTKPGQKFSRTDLIRSQREIANLGFFDAEQIGVVPIPNPADGTVDIEYTVVEKSADQIELSAGWGGDQGLIGTLGLSFNNFSLKNIFKKGTWSPLPTGDGQKFSLRVQSNGKRYQSYNFSFTEPWLGGKRKNPFTVSWFRTRFQRFDSNNDSYNNSSLLTYQKEVVGTNGETQFVTTEYQKRSLQITNGATLALGTQLKRPDDNFFFQGSISYKHYSLTNFATATTDGVFGGRPDTTSNFHNLNFGLTLARSSLNQGTYPSRGANVTLSVNFTPPYSLFGGDKDYENIKPDDKFKLVEYHKWRFNVDWFVPLDRQDKLVFRTSAKFGFMGAYNTDLGIPPFERFEVGGNGLPQNITLFGTTSISQRGYNIYSQNGGDALFNKFTMELRYPLSKNPQATIYALMFMEAGNSYSSFKEYNPFKLNKSVGVGLRAFLPFFGLLGFDYGIRFDSVDGSPITPASGFFDYLGKNGEFSIILGFEPE